MKLKRLLALLCVATVVLSDDPETGRPDITMLYKGYRQTCISGGNTQGYGLSFMSPEISYDVSTDDFKYIHENGTEIDSSGNCDFEDETCVDKWMLDNNIQLSGTGSKNIAPLVDDRWNNLRLYRTNGISDKSHYYTYKTYFRISKKFLVGISIRANMDAQILLCSTNNPKWKACYWIIIDGFANQEVTAIRKCVNGVPDKYATSDEPDCKELRQSKTIPGKLLNENKWTHFILSGQSFSSQNQIQLWAWDVHLGETTLLNYFDDDNPISMSNMYVRSYNAIAEWKIHSYRFLATLQPKTLLQLGPILNFSSTICISFYVTMCQKCKIDIILTREDGIKVMEQTIEGNSNEKFLIWRNVRLQSRIEPSPNINYVLYSTLSTTEHVQNPFWAFDDFRKCAPNEIRMATIVNSREVICQSLKFSNWTFNPYNQILTDDPPRCADKKSIGLYCNISCTVVGTNSCEDSRICLPVRPEDHNGACICAAGNTWDGNHCKRCYASTYGYNCENKCGKCKNNNYCDTITGQCPQGCQFGYQPPLCTTTYPRFVNPLEVIQELYTSMSVKFVDSEINGPKDMIHQILIECRKVNTAWFNCSDPIGNIHPGEEIRISNLQQETEYYIRAVIYTKNGDAYIADDLPYAIGTTSCKIFRQINVSKSSRNATIFFETSGESCRFDGYRLKLIQNNTPTISDRNIQQNMILKDLKPYTKYEIELTHQQHSTYRQQEFFETEQDAPGPISDIQILKQDSTEVFLTWKKPEEENGIIQKYNVTYQIVQRINCKEKIPPQSKTIIVEPFDISRVHLSDLQPYSSYYVTIFAVTVSRGKEIGVHFETSMIDEISEEEIPESIYTQEVTDQKVTIRWKAVSCIKQKGPLFFDIVIKCIKSEWCSEVKDILLANISNINTGGTTYSLTPFTNYIAELRAKRNMRGPLTITERVIEFASLAGSPPLVRNLSVYSKEKKSISLRWLDPYPPHGNLESFQIKYCYTSFSTEYCNKADITSEKFLSCDFWDENFNCFELTNLYAEYSYTLSVRAKNKDSRFPGPENIVTTVTKEERPDVPLNLTQQWKNNEIYLYWNHPNITNGHLKKFIIVLVQNETELTNQEKKEPYTYVHEIQQEQKSYSYKIQKSFRYSSSYVLTICAVNSLYGENTTLIIDTPPETPELDSSIILDEEKITNTSVIITIPGAKKNTKSKTSFLYVVVSTEDTRITKRDTQNPENLKDGILKFAKHQNSWIAIERKLSEKEIVVEIGDDTKDYSLHLNEEIHNKKLQPDTDYDITVVAINQYREQISAQEYTLHIKTITNDVVSSAIWALLLLLFLPFIGFFVYRYVFKKETRQTSMIMPRRLRSEDHHEPDVIPLTEAANEPSMTKPKKPAIAPKPGSSNKLPETVAQVKENPTETNNFFHSRIVLLENLEDYLKEVLENGELEEQHALFPRGQTKPWDYGMLKPNKFKNRYNNLVAYDKNRVKLEKINNDQYSDYINANYIHGYRQDKAYIATQGPKLATVNDFWRMIWQEKTQYIIMLANVVEAGKKKCEKYWPDIDSSREFGNIEVFFEKSELYADYEYRTFKVTCKGETRKVYQLHFTSWPDHGVPIYPQSLVPFLKKMLTIPQSTAPIVVHCSAGVGRTGTIILCDICLRMAAREKAIDVLRYLHEIREQRANMVDNVDQYKLVHMILLECLLAPDTNIPCNAELSNSIKKLIEEGGLQIQLNYLQQTSWQDKALNFVAPKKPDPANESKNRFNDIVPSENQIYISRYPVDDENSDYINAVPVDGFRFKEQFIVTQLPMPNTVKDFWRMIAEKTVKVIVCLNDIPTDDQTCCNFWPQENEELKPVPNIHLKYHKMQQNDFYDVYSIILDNKSTQEATMIKIVQFKNWAPNSKLPENEENLVMLWEETENLSRGNHPMVVTCYDGSTACGLFVAMSFVIEKIKLEQQCDPCLAVRVVRRNRKQFVSNKVQFEFLYRSAVIYLSMFETYSNFQPVVHKNN